MGPAVGLWSLWIPAACLSTAILSVRGPLLAGTYLLPMACLAAIGFVVSHAIQENEYACRGLMVLAAAAAGLSVRQLLPEILPPTWIPALVLAGMGVTTAYLAGQAASRMTGRLSPTFEARLAGRLMHLGWWIALAYAFGWAAQAMLDFSLAVRFVLVVCGVALFLGLTMLLTSRMRRANRRDSLPAEMGLYFCWLNLALLGFWLASQDFRALTGA